VLHPPKYFSQIIISTTVSLVVVTTILLFVPRQKKDNLSDYFQSSFAQTPIQAVIYVIGAVCPPGGLLPIILVSPWMDARIASDTPYQRGDENAIEKAQKYNMQMYSYIEDVKL